MKLAFRIAFFSLAAATFAGCRVPNPYLLPPDPPPPPDRYQKTVVEQEERGKVAVHVYPTRHVFGSEVARELDAQLSEAVGSLAFFELVPRSNTDPLVTEALLNGESDSVILPADYVISAKAMNIQIEEESPYNRSVALTLLTINDSSQQKYGQQLKSYSATLTVNFQFFHCAQKRTIRTKTVTRTAKSLLEGAIQNWFTTAARDCAREFTQSLGGRYAPEARVMQTRGKHEMALVSIGSNYGLSIGTEVTFFTYLDTSPFLDTKRRYKNIIGTGRVAIVEEDAAWVEVFDYDRVRVEQGMYVSMAQTQRHEFRWRYFFRGLGNLFRY